MKENIEWPSPQPCLETERLILRPFTWRDAQDLQRLAGDFAVADTTLLIPHPYPDGAAEEFIGKHELWYARQEGVIFAITLKADRALLGSIGLNGVIYRRAELGYWVGQPSWNCGYATEAARAVTQFGFNVLGLHKITSTHFVRNPASGRVQEKLGFVQEGVLRDHVMRWNRFESLITRALFAPP